MDSSHEKFTSHLKSLGFEEDETDLYDDESPFLRFTYDLWHIIVILHVNEYKYDIYYNFTYFNVDQKACQNYLTLEAKTETEKSDIEYLVNNLQQDISRYWKIKALLLATGQPPKEEFDECNLYCSGGSNEYIGYFGCDIEKYYQLPEYFVSIYCNYSNYSANDIRANIMHLLSDYLVNKGYDQSADMSFYSRKQGIRIRLDVPQLQISKQEQLENVVATYQGKEFKLFLGASSNRTFGIPNERCKEYDDLCYLFSWYSEKKIQLDPENRVVIRNGLLLVEMESWTEFDICNLEYMHLMDSLEKFKPFKPSADLQILDFSQLTSHEFEKLCYDYLLASGFQNVHLIGKTMASDGGKDIIAEHVARNPLGTEISKYIVQCKHSKTSLSREKITEIPEILRENNANKYLLICSNDISPQAIDRLAKLNERISNSIAYWGKIELSTRLYEYPRLIHQYKLLPKGLFPTQ